MTTLKAAPSSPVSVDGSETIMIRVFDDADPAMLCDIAMLHSELLPHSPIVRAGKAFMKDFYYRFIGRDGKNVVFVVYARNEPAGFIVATTASKGCMMRMAIAHPFRLMWTLTRMVISEPEGLIALWEGLYIMLRNPNMPDCGEILSMGVRREFLKTVFWTKSGTRLSSRLLDVALKELKARGVHSVRLIVDDDNLAAQLLYLSHGWRVTSKDVPGWSVPSREMMRDI